MAYLEYLVDQPVVYPHLGIGEVSMGGVVPVAEHVAEALADDPRWRRRLDLEAADEPVQEPAAAEPAVEPAVEEEPPAPSGRGKK